ncbi:MAG: phosphoglucosamine mutase [Patescibacteria group bacterium]|jgi:phosphomannomutase
MPLIKSISGIRGTIGGVQGENLTPQDIIRFTTAYVLFIKQNNPNIKVKIVVGRDARISGEMIKNLVVGALVSQGANAIDLGLASTPTVEMAVLSQKAQGGIIISASHNPQGWNALKLLDGQGEFLTKIAGEKVLALAEQINFPAVSEDQLGFYILNPFLTHNHLEEILNLELVDKNLIASRNFKVVVDGINSVGGMIVPELLKMLGVKDIVELNCEPNGIFAHKPEPLAENLTQIMEKVKAEKADLGIVVDPDVDRLAFVMENGEMLSEEYTLVAVADYVLANFESVNAKNSGRYNKSTVSNLSSSRALKDITEKHGGTYEAAAVGEVNVVTLMKKNKCVIGGEGNGGVIFPELHYGRDALVGIALFLSYLAKRNIKISELKRELPEYFMVKDKIELTSNINVKEIMEKIRSDYASEKITDIDGLKIDWPDSWVHLRASNTEPIIRVYAEAKTMAQAEAKVKEIKDKILAYIK